MADNWLRSMRRPGRTKRVRTLTNNPERGSNTFGGLKGVGFAQRGVRRLMKVDPQNAQGTPASQLKLQTPGMSDNQGSPVRTVKGHTESRRVQKGTAQQGPVKAIVDRSKKSNIRGLKKR